MTLVTAAAITLCGAIAAQTADRTNSWGEIERPTGKYQIAYLTLATEKVGEGPRWLVLSLRDGWGAAAWVPSFAQAVDAGGFTRPAGAYFLGQSIRYYVDEVTIE
jgi:hypothetical protein